MSNVEQSATYNLMLYENIGISITYDINGNISAISNTGETLDYTTCNKPEFVPIPRNAQNNQLLYDYILRFEIDGLISNEDELEKLVNNINGWVAKIQLGNNKTELVNSSFWAEIQPVDTYISHTNIIEMKTRILTTERIKYFA